MQLSGSPVDYAVVFGGGVLISLTPCVYPLIPVSAGYIGVRGAASRLQGFLLSVTYVTGMALTYAALGIIASLSGKIFGTVSANPWTNIAVGAVIVVSGLSFFDLVHIPLPRSVRLPSHTRGNYWSTLLLGIVSGLVIGPCTTPALGAILVYLATQKNLLYGGTLLFVFAFGMGTVLILAGTFSSLLLRLPKSGAWLDYSKRIAGAVLVALGGYFLYTGIRRL